MKTVLLGLLLITLSGNPLVAQMSGRKEANKENADTTGGSKYPTTKDTVLIVSEIDDTLRYRKEDFNEIAAHFQELYSGYAEEPDLAYNCAAAGYSNTNLSFGGEAGQDDFYVLYAFFLKMKNDDQKHAARRKKLIGLYSNINSLFATFEHGGTYFGHQHKRIPGYAEYSVYLYVRGEKFISKTYTVAKQKELYIRSLRQLIDDESKIDRSTTAQEKIQRNKKLNQTVDAIDKAITDNYYLRRTQEFQYRHYEYY